MIGARLLYRSTSLTMLSERAGCREQGVRSDHSCCCRAADRTEKEDYRYNHRCRQRADYRSARGRPCHLVAECGDQGQGRGYPHFHPEQRDKQLHGLMYRELIKSKILRLAK